MENHPRKPKQPAGPPPKDGSGGVLGTQKPLPTEPGFLAGVPRQNVGFRGLFQWPPFSLFRTNDGEWVRRKDAWLKLGIASEVGRAGAMTYQLPFSVPKKGQIRKWDGSFKEKVYWRKEVEKDRGGGTSVFDPVLCELMYTWFCPPGGQIIDPFAGGSVRGIVAHYLDLGYRYWGSELRPEQVEANREQAAKIVPDNRPTWVCGDAKLLLPDAPEADFIFTCPPYGFLEVYSQLDGDLSNMGYPEFRKAYLDIICLAAGRLRENRFACFVVANFRDKKNGGFYHDLVGDTVRCFRKAGMGLYNEAILITAIGSLPIRIKRQFSANRKIGKTHQNVLVFYKGDPMRIREEFPC